MGPAIWVAVSVLSFIHVRKMSKASNTRPRSQGPACAAEPGDRTLSSTAALTDHPMCGQQRLTAFSPKSRLHRPHFTDEVKDVAQGHKALSSATAAKVWSEPFPRAPRPCCLLLLPSFHPAKGTLPSALSSPPGPSSALLALPDVFPKARRSLSLQPNSSPGSPPTGRSSCGAGAAGGLSGRGCGSLPYTPYPACRLPSFRPCLRCPVS